jgi:[ribosomal protein S5]-alanine N-acetyltransferase
MIRTPRLRLIPCDESLLRAIVAGPEAASARLDVVIPAGWPEFPEAFPYALERLSGGNDLRPWWTYVFIDDTRGALVGSGGYKGPPGPDGIVELGYETAPAFRGRGYASEVVAGMIAFAFSHPEVTAVDAHTLPERNTSARILERNGLRHLGAVDDPDDGTIWHWRLTREEWREREGRRAS